MAERVLLSLVHALGDRAKHLTVLGGLVPEVLTRNQEPPAPTHLGTTDVDVMLAVHVAGSDPMNESLEQVMERLGFVADPGENGWRWIAAVDGHSVKIEFLCDLHDQRDGVVVRPAGCHTLGALNLRGTGYAEADAIPERIDGALVDQPGNVALDIRFAGLAGYLMAKAHAVVNRAAGKDYYDFAYVVLHNRAGGPSGAAAAIVDRFPEAARATRLWAELSDRFGSPDRVGPANYAHQHALVDVEADPAVLKNDAAAGVGELIGILRARG